MAIPVQLHLYAITICTNVYCLDTKCCRALLEPLIRVTLTLCSGRALILWPTSTQDILFDHSYRSFVPVPPFDSLIQHSVQ